MSLLGRLLFLFLWAFLDSGVLVFGDERQDDQTCWDVFDISNRTIIKATESVGRGARFLGAVSEGRRSRWECQLACCRTAECNIAVYQDLEDRDCYLFDCGTPQDFKCVFSVHDNYVAMGMMIDRKDLEKTRIHEQSKHEVDLNVMKVKQDKVEPPPYSQPRDSYRPQSQESYRAQPPQELYRQPPPPQESYRPAPPLPPQPQVRHREDLESLRGSKSSGNGFRVLDKSVGKARSPFADARPAAAPAPAARAACHSRYEWRCGSGECIPVYDVCTGVAQCVDGSDEDAQMCRRRLENMNAQRAREKEGGPPPTPKTPSGSMSAQQKAAGKKAPVGSGGSVLGGAVQAAASPVAVAVSGEERVGLAGIVLALGVLLLVSFFIFLCIRFRATKSRVQPVRRRQGKYRDSEEGDLLITNGLHL